MSELTDPTLQLLRFDGGIRVIADYRASLFAIHKPHHSYFARWEPLFEIHATDTATRIIGAPLPVERVTRILGPVRQVDTIDSADLAEYGLTRQEA